MSLLIWLPLHGNLNNQGLSPIKFNLIETGGGVGAASSGGKTNEKCYARTTANTTSRVESDTTLLLSGDFTMACWCLATTPGNATSANGVITNHDHSYNSNKGSGAGITLKYTNDTTCYISCNTSDASGRTFNAYYGTTNIYGAWHHLCLTYKKSTITYRLYVDGKCEKEFSLSNPNQAVANKFNLFDWSTTHSHKGEYKPACKLNDVRVYDQCLSQKEISLLSQGLIAHYKLSSNTNGFTVGDDSSGYSYHGTPKGGTFTVSSSTGGRNGAATKFSTGTYIACGREAMVRDAITINWWGNLSDWTTYATTPLRAISCAQSGGWLFEPSSSKMCFSCGTGSTSNTYKSAVSPTTFDKYAAGWHMFTGTYDGLNLKLYIDGQLEKNTSAYTTKTPIFYNASNGIFIGAEAGGSATTADATYFDGLLSDVRIYCTALSADDILELYQTAGSVTSEGKLMAYNLIERSSGNAGMNKSGVFYADTFNERESNNQFSIMKQRSALGSSFQEI